MCKRHSSVTSHSTGVAVGMVAMTTIRQHGASEHIRSRRARTENAGAINLAGLCVLQREPLIRIWTNAALNAGWSKAEIKEMGMSDRGGKHLEQHLAGYAGLMQADAYAGFSRLYEANRKTGPIVEAACWAHGRRKFFDLARLSKPPVAAEAVKRIDVLFAIEREINGLSPEGRLRVRQERSRPAIAELQGWLREQRAKLSRNNDTTKAINYCLSRWDAFTRFLDDGRLCMSNNAAEREVRAVAVGRKNWTFAGSDEGGRRAAAIYTLIATAKLSDVDPQAWLADVLARINDHAIQRLDQLLPWNWRKPLPEHVEAA